MFLETGGPEASQVEIRTYNGVYPVKTIFLWESDGQREALALNHFSFTQNLQNYL